MSAYSGQKFITLPAASAIGPNLRVGLSGSTIPGLVAAAGLNAVHIGVTRGRAVADTSAGSTHTVEVELDFPVQIMQTAGAVALHAAVYSAAAGQIDDVSTSAGAIIGYALEAATAANAEIPIVRAATMTA